MGYPTITSENLLDELRAMFPEIEDSYQKELKEWDGESPGNYNVVAFVFKPYLRKELEKGEISEFLQRFASFLERVCSSGDTEVINVMWLKFFKLLLGQPTYLHLLWPILGSETRANIKDAATRWNRSENIPVL